MLKFIFVCLLSANAGLFAFHQGYLDELIASGHEPGRLRKQINADKIKLLPLDPVPAPALALSEAPAATQTLSAVAQPVLATAAGNETAEKKVDLACVEIGNFTIAEARKLEAQWARLGLADKPVRRDVTETSSHMIFMPPQNGKEGADKKAGELRALGVTDLYVIQDNPDMRWGISLGIFKTEEAARAQLAALSQKGVRSARLVEHKTGLRKAAYRLYAPGAQMDGYIDKIKNSFPNQETRSCA